ncbi:MAG: hypothetical protein IT261_00435 [Saprospiraceae bacterium]|nr:hypothetical protein [Saprospiraceae bacterium]
MHKLLIRLAGSMAASLLAVNSIAQTSVLPRRITLPEELKEVSGMTRLANGELWLLNDSRNPSNLYRYDPAQKKITAVHVLKTRNYDWEDLTHDTAGNLYIGDFGNNNNKRQNLRILVFNPTQGTLDSILFRYPDQTAFPPEKETNWNFNCEAMVYYQDSLHLFSKNAFKGNFYCKHYVIPAKPGPETVATLRDSILINDRVITGAALSRDGNLLALTGYIMGRRLGLFPYSRASVMYFTKFKGSMFLKGKQHRKRLPKFLIARQFESITQWDGTTWMVANEGRGSQVQRIWRISLNSKR